MIIRSKVELDQIILSLLAALILGASKAGIKGMGIIIIAIFAYVFGAKSSTGIVVPLLILGDILAVIYYKREVKWNYIIKLIPSVIIGVLVAVWIGKDLPEATFKKGMAVIILISVLYVFWKELRIEAKYPDNWLFTNVSGIAVGFTTMLGNLAGPFSNIYFLATKLPKAQLIATAAYLFFFINIFKLPFHIFSWKTVNAESLTTNLMLAPAVIIGFYIGLKIVNLFSEKSYRIFLLVVTAIGGIVIFL